MFDLMTVLFWTAAYACIVYHAVRHRKEPAELYMPLISGCLNFAWEVNALLRSQGYWGHILWLVLDAVILFFNLRWLRGSASRALYGAAVVIATGLLLLLFRQPGPDWMLLSSFVIDVIMALEFLLRAKDISRHGKLLIAAAKMLGDIGAFLGNRSAAAYVLPIGLVVLVVNLLYLSYCLEERSRVRKKKKKR